MRNRTEMNLLVDVNLLDNVTELITPVKHREVQKEEIESTLNLIDSIGYTQYSGATTYSVGAVVIHQDRVYRAIAVSTGITPPNVAYWLELSKPFSSQTLWGLSRAATSTEVIDAIRADLYISPLTLAEQDFASTADITNLQLQIDDLDERIDLLEAVIPQTLDSVLTAGNTSGLDIVLTADPLTSTYTPNGMTSTDGSNASVVTPSNVAVGNLITGDGITLNATEIIYNEGGVTTTLDIVTPTISRTLSLPDQSGVLSIAAANTVIVNSVDDLPAAVASYHTLLSGYTYIFPTNIDLGSNGLRTTGTTTILGWSSETTTISNLGLVPVLTCEDTTVVKWLSFSGGDVVIDALTSSAFDWVGVNLLNNKLVVNDANNVILDTCLLLRGLQLLGTVNTIATTDTLLSTTSSGIIFEVGATAVVNRRIRITTCAFVTATFSTLFKLNAGYSIQDDSFIMDHSSVSGAAGVTYFDGFTIEDNICSFTENKAPVVMNSRTVGEFYWEGNALSTGIGVAGTYATAETTITTTVRDVRTSIDLNEITIDNSIGGDYDVVVLGTIGTATSKQVGLALFKNGTLVNGTAVKGYTYSTAGGDRIENLTTFTTITLVEGDILSIGVTNYTDTTNVTLIDAKLKVTK